MREMRNLVTAAVILGGVLELATASRARAVVPVNDTCAAPAIIPSLPFAATLDTVDATVDSGEPTHSCGGLAADNRTVWYRLTRASSATIVVDTVGSAFDTVVAVFRGSCGTPSEVVCNDDAVGLQSRAAFPIAAGETVLIGVGGFAGERGQLQLHVDEVPKHPCSVVDASGDTLGVGATQLDVTSFSVCERPGANAVDVTLDFSAPIALPDAGTPNALGGLIELDTDQDATTGDVSAVDALSSQVAGLGVEYEIVIDDYDPATGTVGVFDRIGGTTIGRAATVFTSTRVIITVPVALLGGDDGRLNAAAAIGTATETTDVVPDGGYVIASPECACGAVCGNGQVEAGEQCGELSLVCGEGQVCVGCSCSCTNTLAINGINTAESDFCIDIALRNGDAVRGVQAVLSDLPDEFDITGVQCTSRTAGFSCLINEVSGTNVATLLVVDPAGGCIVPGNAPIARLCLHDRAPICRVESDVTFDVSDIRMPRCGDSAGVAACSGNGQVHCGTLGDCLADDGVITIFDVNHKVDIVLGRTSPTAPQSRLCDADCDGDIDIFDIVRAIDVLVHRLPTPLACPNQAHAALRTDGSVQPSVRRSGRRVMLDNGTAVRGVELELEATGGAVKLTGVDLTRRTRGFRAAFHQATPGGPARVVVYSETGAIMRGKAGPIVRLRTQGPGRLRIRLAKIVSNVRQ